MSLLSISLLIISILLPVLAHPGEQHSKEDIANEIRARSLQNIKTSRSLASCASSLKYRTLQNDAAARRLEKMTHLRKKRGIKSETFTTHRRDLSALESWDSVQTNYTTSSYTLSTSPSTLFGSNASCILASEVTQGPYYAKGEYVRSDISEDESGVPLHLELQFIDSNTCEAVSDMYLDIWSANATGVYSGVVANGNGDASDTSNINNTALRGIQPVDSTGVVQFTTLIPGFYTGRAPHIHLLATVGATLNSNNTITGGNIAHVGQLFFAQDLLTSVFKTSPYTSNTGTLTLNDEDTIAQAQASTSYDPYVSYAYLGEDVSEGLLAWISIAVDTTASYDVSAAAVLTEDGGESESSGAMGGGGNSTSSGSVPGSGSPPGAAGNGTVSMTMGGAMNGSAPTGAGNFTFSAVSTLSGMASGGSGAMTSYAATASQDAAASTAGTDVSASETSAAATSTSVTVTGGSGKFGGDALLAAGVAGVFLLGYGSKWFFF